jgi:hypothetical protein
MGDPFRIDSAIEHCLTLLLVFLHDILLAFGLGLHYVVFL